MFCTFCRQRSRILNRKANWGGGEGPLDEECLSITHTDRYTHPDGEGRQAKEP